MGIGGGVPRVPKLRLPSAKNPELTKTLFFLKPGVGQNIALRASLNASNSVSLILKFKLCLLSSFNFMFSQSSVNRRCSQQINLCLSSTSFLNRQKKSLNEESNLGFIYCDY